MPLDVFWLRTDLEVCGQAMDMLPMRPSPSLHDGKTLPLAIPLFAAMESKFINPNPFMPLRVILFSQYTSNRSMEIIPQAVQELLYYSATVVLGKPSKDNEEGL